MPTRWTDSVVRAILPNGLTLLVQRDTSVPVVAVVTHVKAGYFDEPDEWVGIAHVLEHMFFKGTPTHGPGTLARETQRLGGYLNAGTIYDKTVYYAVVPSADDGLRHAVDLQADALMHAALDPDELGRELEVIIQEARRKLDNPAAVTGETLYELLFRRHPMRRWRIGTEAGLRALTAGDVRAYYETRYRPDRTIVALTGDLDPDEALALGERVYGSWSRPAVEIPPWPREPDARLGEFRSLSGDVERPLAAMGWRTVDADHPDTPALDVAAGILGSGRASWLTMAVRVPGLASAAAAGHYTPGDVGVFDISLTGALDTMGAALERSFGLTGTLGREGPDDGQVARLRALLATAWARRLESADGRATLLAEFEAMGGYERAETYRAALDAVTAADVRDAAARWLVPDAACGVVYLPADRADAMTGLPWPPAGGGNTPAALVRSPAVPARTVPTGTTRTYGDVRLVRWPGVDLLVRRRAGTDLVTVGVQIPGLPLEEDPVRAGRSQLLLRTSLRGAGGMSADGLAAAAERLGGSIGLAGDADRAGLVLSVRADAALSGARLLRTVLERPTLDAADVGREVRLQADDAARRRDDTFGYPLEGALRAAFAPHPYGLPGVGEPEAVGETDAADLRRWHERACSSRVLVVAVGDLDLDGLVEAGAAFADWPGRAELGAPAPPVWNAGHLVESRAKTQSALAMAFPGPTAASADRHAHAVLSALLSGLAGRLFEELRERRALAYTVYAAPWLRRHGGAVLTYIATSPDREDEARDAMLDVLGRVADGPLADDELERAASYAAGLVPIGRQRGQAVAEELIRAWHQGWLDGFADVEAGRRAVTAADLRRIARETFDPDRRAEFVLRGTGGGR